MQNVAIIIDHSDLHLLAFWLEDTIAYRGEGVPSAKSKNVIGPPLVPPPPVCYAAAGMDALVNRSTASRS